MPMADSDFDPTADFKQNGYLLLRECFTSEEAHAALQSVTNAMPRDGDSVLASGNGIYAARNLTSLWSEYGKWAFHPCIVWAISRFAGEGFGLVRAIYFDKNPGTPWGLPWHQDLAIAVREHAAVSEEYSNPSVKRGVPHVEAPESLLSRMITARIHLDDADESNGALEVIAGSHRGGKRWGGNLENQARRTLIACNVGDVLLMRPLLYHRSSKPSPDSCAHRRVLHFEFAPNHALPEGLDWYEFQLAP